MNTAEPRFMSVAEAARFVNLSEKTIRRLIEENKIPSIRVGNSIRIPVRWRDQLLQAADDAHEGDVSE
jgi:excisionase family DNA binding protein